MLDLRVGDCVTILRAGAIRNESGEIFRVNKTTYNVVLGDGRHRTVPKNCVEKKRNRNTEIYGDIFLGFSTLSDVQEMVAMGFSSHEIVNKINHAKKHLMDAQDGLALDYDEIQVAMGKTFVSCDV